MNRSRRFWDDFKSFAFSGSLLKVAVAFVLATPGELRALRSAVQPVYDRYLETRPTGDFVRRIQAMKASMPPISAGVRRGLIAPGASARWSSGRPHCTSALTPAPG